MPSTAQPTAGEAHLARLVERLAIPTEFQLRILDSVPFNDIELWRARFEYQDGRNNGLGGEHISVLYDKTGSLFGFTRMEARFAGGCPPSHDEALSRAYSILGDYAGDILEDLASVWIKPHEQTLMIDDPGAASRALRIGGLKALFCNREDGRYTWVVFAGDGETLAFERDIKIDPLSGERLTQAWLHDNRLQAQAGP